MIHVLLKNDPYTAVTLIDWNIMAPENDGGNDCNGELRKNRYCPLDQKEQKMAHNDWYRLSAGDPLEHPI